MTRVQVELELHRTPTGVLAGTAGVAQGPCLAFTGLMDFVAVLGRLLEHSDVCAHHDGPDRQVER